jgi:hypothetical protein
MGRRRSAFEKILLACPIKVERCLRGSPLRMALVALLLSSAVLTAQPYSTTASFASAPKSEWCPVHFFVGRTATPAVMASSVDQSSGFGLGLEVNFFWSGVSKMVKTIFPVNGSSNKASPLPTATNTNADRTETVELRRDTGEQGLLHSTAWLRKMRAIGWVDSTEIEYEDGSTWTLLISFNAGKLQISFCRSRAQ